MKVIVFSTKTSKKKEYQTSVKTWGELKNLITEDFDLNGLKATENINKTDLSLDSSILPAKDFTLFLRPGQIKSGSEMSFKEARKFLKEERTILEEYRKKCKEDSSLKNWTQLSTKELNELIALTSTEQPPLQQESEVISEEVAIVSSNKNPSGENIKNEVFNKIIVIHPHIDKKTILGFEKIENVVDYLQKINTYEKYTLKGDNALVLYKKETEEEEIKRLLAEANSLV